ncbi:MAG TPA: hypothetical protein VHJ77_11365 [Vicinamibacterales bacterium]|jgi:hypothetical protein|nr:hypothetical protein [Vicinamibacterales bacterium]
MTRSIRRQLRLLHAYVVTSLLVFIVLAAPAFRQPAKPQTFGDITAERGLTLRGREQDGKRLANAGIMFDQLGQDQTIGFDYAEEDGRRAAALKVWDRPDAPLSDLVEKLNAANAIEDKEKRDAAVARVRAEAPKPAQRVLVGKTRERAATVLLSDAEGRTRLALKVEADGTASIDFLDGDGKVVHRVEPGRTR